MKSPIQLFREHLYNKNRMKLLKQLQYHVLYEWFNQDDRDNALSLEESNIDHKRRIGTYYRVNVLMCGFLVKIGSLPRHKFQETYLDAMAKGHISREPRFGSCRGEKWVR